MSNDYIGLNFVAFILGVTVLVIAVTVMLDVYTQPAVDAVRRAKKEHLHLPTWAERFEKRHVHLQVAHNTHKHRRGH
jgi:hypothetical protein